MNRKGDESLFETVIFIVLNMIFIITLLIFILHSRNGTALYEQSYAKQIALLIDEAKPGLMMSISMEKPLNVAKKNNYIKDVTLDYGNLDKIVKVDKGAHRVSVSFGSGSSYSYYYFNGNKFDVISKGRTLAINVTG